jgi:hypothetical protein
MKKLTLSILNDTFAICKFDIQTNISNWISIKKCKFMSITKTEDELSVLCDQSIIPEHIKTIAIEKDWRALKVEGPLDFSLTGILSMLLQPLAEQKISIFALSTYNTDYILVKEKDFSNTIEVLRKKCIVKNPYDELYR